MSKDAAPKKVQRIAAKAIIKHDGKILILKQISEVTVSNYGRYHPPGGIVEPGETLREAVVREVKEECELDVEVGDMLSVEEWRASIRGDDCYFVGVFFICEPKGSLEVHLQAEEAAGYAWVGRDDLAKYDIVEPSLSVIKKALG
jgi:8-oxo-dGTP diphosphatase